MNKKNDVVIAQRLRQDHRVQRDQPDRVPDGVPEVFAPFRELWAGASTTVLPEAHPRGPELQQGLEQLHLRPEDQEADQQRADDGRSRSRPTSRSRWCRTRTTGAGRSPRCRRSCSCPSRDTNSELNAFRSGEVDMIYPQNQIGLRKRIESVDGAEYTTTLGPQWEHFDMLSTVPGLDDVAGPQGDRHRDAPPADRRPSGEGRQRQRRGAEQHAVHGEPAGSTCRTGTSTRRRATSRRPRRSSTRPAGCPAPTACAQKGNVKLAFTVGTTSGNQARDPVRADHPAAAREDRREAHDQELARHPRHNLVGVRLPDHHLRLGRRARPVHRQRDLAVVGDPGAVLEASGQGRRVRLQRAELHQGEGPAGRRAPQRHRPGHRPGACGRSTSTRPTSSSPPTT